MSTAFVIDNGFSQYIAEARKAVSEGKFNQVTIFAIAEYLDLVSAKEIKPEAKLVRECKDAVFQYVLAHVANTAFVPFWERAGCLFKAYKKALKVKEPVEQTKAAALSM